MTPILRKQLSLLCAAVVVGGALGWNGGILRAQIESDPFEDTSALNSTSEGTAAPRRKLTRDEAAQKFVAAMNEKHLDYGLLGASISRQSRAQLGRRTLDLVKAMTEQWKQPKSTVKVQSQSDKTSVVVVEQAPVAHTLILIREDGGWGVDLIETYAKWNNLRGVAKAEAIYKVSGAMLAELPRTDQLKRSVCQSNLRQIALGIREYAADNDELFPSAKANWIDAIQPYVKGEEFFNCPMLPKGARYGYAFNARLSSIIEPEAPDLSKTVSVYETTVLKRHASGLGENRAFRHFGGANYAFADGHVQWFPKTQTPNFNLKSASPSFQGE